MSFMTNIQIQKQFPAVQYEPNTTQEPSGLWHEDHEINGAMYRASNASFDEVHGTWFLKDATQPAYAQVKNTDGSISYLYMSAGSSPWSTSAWLGTGQPLIYHAVNYGMSPTNSAATNTAALQAALNAAFSSSSATGGIIFIPPGVYQVQGTISLNFGGVPGNDHGIIIAGGGGDTEIVQNGFVDLFPSRVFPAEGVYGFETCA